MTTAAAASAIDGTKAQDRNIANDEEDKEVKNVARGMRLVVVLLLFGLVVFVVLVIIDEDNTHDDSDSDSDADPRVELISWLNGSVCSVGGGCWIGRRRLLRSSFLPRI